MPIQKLKEFLDSHNIKYVVISHSVAYTAQGVAALTHISGRELAKAVIVNIDGSLAMALLPASLHIDLSQLRSAASANNVALASEDEFKERFPDCETGAMPPFGNLYDMPVFAWSMVHGIAKLATAKRLPYESTADVLKFAEFVIDRSLPVRGSTTRL